MLHYGPSVRPPKTPKFLPVLIPSAYAATANGAMAPFLAVVYADRGLASRVTSLAFTLPFDAPENKGPVEMLGAEVGDLFGVDSEEEGVKAKVDVGVKSQDIGEVKCEDE